MNILNKPNGAGITVNGGAGTAGNDVPGVVLIDPVTGAPTAPPAFPSNTEVVLYPSTAFSVSGNSADQSNPYGTGIQLTVDITAVSGTSPTLTAIIEGKDPASGKYYTLLASAALAAIGTTTLLVFAGAAAAANMVANASLPRTWRVRLVVAGTTPVVTASIGAQVLL